MTTRVLIVEDDPKLSLLLQSDFELEGYEVACAKDGVEGLEKAQSWRPDIVVLDVTLPRLSGYEVCRQLRRARFDKPILMLTARGQEAEKILGLDLGADDYVSKPVGVLELHARLRALLRRGASVSEKLEQVAFDDVVIHFRQMVARKAGKPIALTLKEFQLLELLIRRENEVVSRDECLRLVWGYDQLPTTRAVDNQILSLRQKLNGKKDYIQTIYGVGYKFVRT